MAELLVSVRSAREAEAALTGGAAIIDVKEPALGSLGRSEATTINSVFHFVAGRRPVSAALGELRETPACLRVEGLAFAKWGLAGYGSMTSWRRELLTAKQSLQSDAPSCQLVAVAYADWRRAQAPLPEQVCAFACEQDCGAFLLDTWAKDGTSLLDWLPVEAVAHLCRQCRSAGLRVALAGSLGKAQMEHLQIANPNWFAVRGAVCQAGQRGQSIDPEAVRYLADFLARSSQVQVPDVDCLHS